MPRASPVPGGALIILHARLCPRLRKNVCLSPDHPQSGRADITAERRKDIPIAVCFVLLLRLFSPPVSQFGLVGGWGTNSDKWVVFGWVDELNPSVEELTENQNWYKHGAWPAWQGGVAEQEDSSLFQWQSAVRSAQDVVLQGYLLKQGQGAFPDCWEAFQL